MGGQKFWGKNSIRILEIVEYYKCVENFEKLIKIIATKMQVSIFNLLPPNVFINHTYLSINVEYISDCENTRPPIFTTKF